MVKVIAEQEHYLLVSDGEHFTVVERRAGRFYPLCKGVRAGRDLDVESMARLARESGLLNEGDARRLLAHVASEWRALFEQIR